MCGIFFSLCRQEHVLPDSGTEQLLKNRGPDSLGIQQRLLFTRYGEHETDAAPLYATFVSTVLALRGAQVTEQPLVDEKSGSMLCWNGEAWRLREDTVPGNDSQVVFQVLLEACKAAALMSSASAIDQIVSVLSSIRGPYAFVFYDATSHHLFFGRDCLGRRSLLKKRTSNSDLIISSVCDNATGEDWAEIEADGIYVLEVTARSRKHPLSIIHIPHRRSKDETGRPSFVGKFFFTESMLT